MLQLFTFVIVFFFYNVSNLIVLWYLCGLYLMSLGLIGLLNDGDIFIGFLWLIDLGVGLIIFIFILHFSTFTQQKITTDLKYKNIYVLLTAACVVFFALTILAFPVGNEQSKVPSHSWFFYISWYDYYSIYQTRAITDLNLLREIYFYNNSFEFFIVNLILFYGAVAAIQLMFVIKRIFNFLNLSQFAIFKKTNTPLEGFFIRNQNFLKQQNTSTGSRVWSKSQIAAKIDR